MLVTAARERFARSVVVACLIARTAWADGTPADEAFKKGRDLLKAGRYAEACEQFEQSQALDPALGTLFNIAQCDEHIGKLASAMAAYREVVSRDTKAERRETANDMASKLATRVPKLVVKVPGDAKHVTITLDNKHVIQPNTPVELDNGQHSIDVRADGMKEFSQTATIVEEGKTVTVTARLEPGTGKTETDAKPDGKKKPDAPPKPTGSETDETPRSSRKTWAIGAMAAGGAALVTGVVYGALASSKWKDAKAVCGGTTCTSQADADRASALGDQARSKANVSTVLFAAGGVIAAVGVVLWVTAPSEHAVAVSARASSDGGALVLSGRF
jgi:tetratricopeptide (TPR) repeat protein